MRPLTCFAAFASAVVALSTAPTSAEDQATGTYRSGQQPGEELVRFSVMKIAGAEEDGEKAGLGLCYCCKYEGQPLVFAFARRSSEPLAALVAGLDQAVVDHKSAKLQAIVSLLGEDQDLAERQVLALERASGAKQVPFVIPFESDNGPVKHHIDPEAELTLIFVKDNRVVRNFAYREAEWNDQAAQVILRGLEQALRE